MIELTHFINNNSCVNVMSSETTDRFAKYRDKHREQIKERDREWKRKKYEEDDEYRKNVLERSGEWAKNNRDKKNEYNNKRRKEKKQERIDYLGGKCVGCGVTEDLQFDHIDRTSKEFSISKKADHELEKIKEELDKCQLLCKECHRIKTRANHDNAELLKGYNLESITKDDGTITIVYRR